MRCAVDTPPKRARLDPRRNPYWHSVAGGRGGVSIGYRRASRGPGVWTAKLVSDGERVEEKLGLADDDGAGDDALSFRAAVAAALDWSARQNAALEARKASGQKNVLTVRSAIERYIQDLARRNARSAATCRVRMHKHMLSDEAFAAVKLSKLRASTIEEWRSRLSVRSQPGGAGMAPATANRLLTDVRAALNAAVERQRRELPSHVMLEVKVGTRAASVDAVARKQLLMDEQVRAVIEAAFDVDPAGDFGPLVLVAAATGARYSQFTRLTVADVQAAQARVMMPG